jgi:hypothetical protein
MTDEVIGVAEDEYKAGFTERFSKWGSAKKPSSTGERGFDRSRMRV